MKNELFLVQIRNRFVCRGHIRTRSETVTPDQELGAYVPSVMFPITIILLFQQKVL